MWNEEERTDEIGFGGLRLTQRPQEFCYGIDAVILADFAARGGSRNRERFYGPQTTLVDLGTGTGIIPLILSRKTDSAAIAGVELQEGSHALAVHNVAQNALAERIRIFRGGVEDRALPARIKTEIGCAGFDAVTCNPPYVTDRCGLTNVNDAKNTARHETSGRLEDFIACAAALLKERGDFYMVHRPARIVDILCLCRQYRLEPKALRLVTPNKDSAPNILLLHCIKGAGQELKLLRDLYVYKTDGSYNEEIQSIYERIT